MQETKEMWVWSLSREDPLEKCIEIQSSFFFCLENPMEAWEAWQVTVHRIAESDMTVAT